MAGRPRRAAAVTPVLLRLPSDLLARVNRCKARLELQEGTSLSRTQVIWRILEAGCEALEEEIPFAEAYPHLVPSAELISEISKRREMSKISEISSIAGDQPEQPIPTPQVPVPPAPMAPSHLATVEEPAPAMAPPMAPPEAPEAPSPALEPAPEAVLAPLEPQADTAPEEETESDDFVLPVPATPTEYRKALLAQIAARKRGGMTLEAIAEKLNTQGIETFSGRGKWTKGALSKQLAGSGV